MTIRQNIEARQKNARSDLTWYAWRLVHFYRLNGGLPIGRDETAVRLCGTPEAARKDQRLPVLAEHFRELGKRINYKNPKAVQTTLELTLHVWLFCHDFDEILQGVKLPKQ